MRFVAHAAALASAVLLAHAAQQQQQQPLLAPPPHAAAPATRVPLRIGLMSKCPDFFAFASTFSRVVDEPGVWRLIDVDYAYIAERARAGPVCKHGASECDGNVQELCVAHVSRALLGEERGQEQAWAFIDCLNYEGGASIGPDAVAQKCLRATKGVHWQDDGVEACVHGHMGRELLEKSAERAERSGIKCVRPPSLRPLPLADPCHQTVRHAADRGPDRLRARLGCVEGLLDWQHAQGLGARHRGGVAEA